MTRRLIRKFDTPTNIMLVGDSLGWILEDGWYRDEFDDKTLNAICLSNSYSVDVSNDGTPISIAEVGDDLNNAGHLCILTEEEARKFYEISEFADAPRFHIDDFIGEIYIGVVITDTDEFITLPLNQKASYLLDDGIDGMGIGCDRFPVVNLEGIYGEVQHNKQLT